MPPNSKAHNIVIGRTWVDSAGDFYAYNATSGSKCVLSFTPCGWFSYGRYEFTGHICDKDGNKKILLSGERGGTARARRRRGVVPQAAAGWWRGGVGCLGRVAARGVRPWRHSSRGS